MRKAKPCESCDFPFPSSIRALVLNGSLKHAPEPSNTEELAGQVVSHMKELAQISSETIRLVDKNIPAGLGFKEQEIPPSTWNLFQHQYRT